MVNVEPVTVQPTQPYKGWHVARPMKKEEGEKGKVEDGAKGGRGRGGTSPSTLLLTS